MFKKTNHLLAAVFTLLFSISLIAFYFILESFFLSNIAVREFSLVLDINTKTRILLENYKTSPENLETIISNTQHRGFFNILLSNVGVISARSKNVEDSSGLICRTEKNNQVDPSKCFKDNYPGMQIAESFLLEISKNVKLFTVKNGDFQLIDNGIPYHIAFSHLQNGNTLVTIVPKPSEKPEDHIRALAFSGIFLLGFVFYFLVLLVSILTLKKSGQTIA